MKLCRAAVIPLFRFATRLVRLWSNVILHGLRSMYCTYLSDDL